MLILFHIFCAFFSLLLKLEKYLFFREQITALPSRDSFVKSSSWTILERRRISALLQSETWEKSVESYAYMCSRCAGVHSLMSFFNDFNKKKETLKGWIWMICEVSSLERAINDILCCYKIPLNFGILFHHQPSYLLPWTSACIMAWLDPH